MCFVIIVCTAVITRVIVIINIYQQNHHCDIMNHAELVGCSSKASDFFQVMIPASLKFMSADDRVTLNLQIWQYQNIHQISTKK